MIILMCKEINANWKESLCYAGFLHGPCGFQIVVIIRRSNPKAFSKWDFNEH